MKLSGTLTVGDVVFYARYPNSEFEQFLKILEERPNDSLSQHTREALESVVTYATITLEGSDSYVRSQAIEKAAEALHILKLCIKSSMHYHSWAKVNISTVILNRSSQTGSLENETFGLLRSRVTHRPKEVSKRKISDELNLIMDTSIEQNQIEQILTDLSNHFQTNNDISKRISRAITWYGKAMDGDKPDEQFVALAVALESLLIGAEGKNKQETSGGINQRLGERAAFLLGSDFKSRSDMEKKAKRLYGLRSKIVHEGETVKEEEVAEMEEFVKRIILTFANHKFTSWENFTAWITQQRYG